jgi:Ca2+-binding RTX toxin-like protein
MRRTTTLTALAALVVAPLGLAAAPAQAAETCDGKVATIVVPLKPGSFSTDPVTGTPGDDVIVGSKQSDDIDGAGGNDTICGLAGADDLAGGPGDDRLFGGLDEDYSPDDDYYGDVVAPGPGDDYVDLGHDPQSEDLYSIDTGYWDQVSYRDAAGAVVVDLGAGTATGEGTDTIAPITYGGGIEGSAYDDRLTGQAGPDWITAGGGDDTVTGEDGDDMIDADEARRYPSYDDDPQPGDDVVDGGGGDDRIDGGHGTDLLAGGEGDDSVRAVDSSGTRVLGGPGRDAVGGSGDVRVEGQGGRDTLWPEIDGPGLIDVVGGTGRDVVRLDVTRDLRKGTRVVIGRTRGVVQIGDEHVVRFSSAPRFVLNAMHAGPVTWFGTGGRDVADLENANRAVRAYGRGGQDKITGSWERDVLDGGPGRDVLDGSAGLDRCLRGERLQSCERRR